MRHVAIIVCLTATSVVGGQSRPDVLHYAFDQAGSVAVNSAQPGSGLAQAPIDGHLVWQRGQILTGLSGAGGTSTNSAVRTGWTTDLGTDSWTMMVWLDLTDPSVGASFGYVCGDITAGNFRLYINGLVGGPGNAMLRGPFRDVLIPGGASSFLPVHLTFVYDNQAREIRGYLDGSMIAAESQVPLNITGTGEFLVGGYGSNEALPNGAQLDEFRIWRRALTNTEIAASWNRKLDLVDPAGPAWQPDGPGASLVAFGGSFTSIAPYEVDFSATGSGSLFLSGGAQGQLFDVMVTASGLLARDQGAPETVDGQVLNLDPLATDLTALFGLFQSPPFAPLSVPVTGPSGVAWSMQLGILDPSQASGLSLSRALRANF